ncbi:hypothetical protein FRC98_03195 [Lujinxingia vulgaris]|uniref:Uncharacterized protein n=1 Tax=Lujinxingia vulgaris TaxID=2600176 RepID=A0A5C6XBW9_9DELT|nr:hypothetical protein [Lujinxingia vulgaris]TXD39417.1 hypothetical protein FRC98_03195 [Lujinxingia vulgaris]
MFDTLWSSLNLYQQPNGSMSFCITDIEEKACDAGLDEVCSRAESALEACAHSQLLDDQWANSGQTGLPSRADAVKTSALIARTLSQIHDVCQTFGSQHRDTPRKLAAIEVLRVAFPRGVRPVVASRLEEQLAAYDLLIQRLQRDLHVQLGAVGITDLVADLITYKTDFARQLAVHDDVLSFERVNSARHAAREAFAAVIIQVLASTLDQPELRASLLASLRDQQARIAIHHRRRGKNVTPDDHDIDIIELPTKPEDDLDLPDAPDAE